MPKQPVEASSMDQVRDLLMGSQLKDMETRLQRQEEKFQREISSLRDNVQNRVESLENFMKSEAASLLHRLQEEKAERGTAFKNEQKERAASLKAEQKEREDAMKKLAQEIVAKEEALERKLTAISSTLDTAEQELRKLMLSENARLSQTVEEKYQEALNSLSTTALQIRHDVVSRSAISALFAEAAMRFSDQIAARGDTETVGKEE